MKKLLAIFVSVMILLLVILYFQKFSYPIKSDPFGKEVVIEANNLLSNPIERFLLIGYEAKEVKRIENENTYILNAKTIFKINFAEILITCNGQNCSGEVL